MGRVLSAGFLDALILVTGIFQENDECDLATQESEIENDLHVFKREEVPVCSSRISSGREFFLRKSTNCC